jgi:hypothetical protein
LRFKPTIYSRAPAGQTKQCFVKVNSEGYGVEEIKNENDYE